jgi:hypothetical protein
VLAPRLRTFEHTRHRNRSRLNPNLRTMNRLSRPRSYATRLTSIGKAGRLRWEWVAEITRESPSEFTGMRKLIIPRGGLRVSHVTGTGIAHFCVIATAWRQEGERVMATYTVDVDWKLDDGADFPKGR